jgi:nucleoside phosphorylase
MILVTYAMPEEKPRIPWSDTLVPVQTGIGKVLAVSQVARHLNKNINLIISVGFCGGLNGTRQRQMVMPTAARQWDLYLGDLEIPLGHGYGMHCPVSLPEVELESVPNPVRGEMISGDRFVDSSVHVDPHAVAVDMETAALAVLACELRIPFVSIREVSDVADGPQLKTHQQFMDTIRLKGPDYSNAILELAERNPKDIPPPRKIT